MVLGYAYENLAASIGTNVTEVEELIGNRDGYIRRLMREVDASSKSAEEPSIFIGYSRRDQRWLDRLLVHLGPLMSPRQITVWSDRDIKLETFW